MLSERIGIVGSSGGKTWLSCGGMLIGGLVFGLLLAEVLLRLYFTIVPTPSDSHYLADDLAGFIRRPTQPGERLAHEDDHINALGFRDREHDLTKDETTFRVLGIGDSFVFSLVPLDQNFLRVAERKLSNSPPRGFTQTEMIMMGMGAWSTENEVGALESIGLDLEPDFVLLSFFVGNDVTDIPLTGKVLRGRLYYEGSPYPVLNFLRKSMVYLLLERNLLYRLRDRLINRQVDAKVPTTSELIIPDMRDEEALLPDHYLHHQMKRLRVYESPPDPRVEKLWERAEAALEHFDDLCRSAGLPWALHLIPAEIQVDEKVRARVLEALGQEATGFDFDYPQNRLRDFAEKHEIRIVDALPLMRSKHNPDDPLYIQFDTHWNTRGNRLAGEALADSISFWMKD